MHQPGLTLIREWKKTLSEKFSQMAGQLLWLCSKVIQKYLLWNYNISLFYSNYFNGAEDRKLMFRRLELIHAGDYNRDFKFELGL